jgi:hypothetical protein
MNDEKKELLKDRRVVEEIDRHRWIESERAGHDIGLEKASTDWLERFSKAWMDYHMPKGKPAAKGKIENRTFGKK